MFADKIWGDYKFHLVILLCCVLAELVGPIRIPLGGVTITPVSYTHLDVYKRQRIGRLPAASPIR